MTFLGQSPKRSDAFRYYRSVDQAASALAFVPTALRNLHICNEFVVVFLCTYFAKVTVT